MRHYSNKSLITGSADDTNTNTNTTTTCNVLCVLPTYKEEVGDVTRTLDSLMNQKSERQRGGGGGSVEKRIVMVCDGFFYYAEVSVMSYHKAPTVRCTDIIPGVP